jgi:guanylate kinase
MTTRPKRDYEQHNIDYIFSTKSDFANEEMIESTVFNGWMYGTPLHSLKKNIVNVAIVTPSGMHAYYNHPEINVLKTIYLYVPDNLRLKRQLDREQNPNCDEIVRRYSADKKDFEDVEKFLNIEVMNNITLLDLQNNIDTIKDIIG